jgi:predicted membrane GTPase involved in stress response
VAGGILHHNFHAYEPFKGEITHRTRGALIALEEGISVAYGMAKLQDRSSFFIEPGVRVYAGMIVGENSREHDMVVNVCKTKQLFIDLLMGIHQKNTSKIIEMMGGIEKYLVPMILLL